MPCSAAPGRGRGVIRRSSPCRPETPRRRSVLDAAAFAFHRTFCLVARNALRYEIRGIRRASMACDVSKFANLNLFEHLNDDDRAALAGVVNSMELAGQSTLFRGGDPGESLFVVRKGEVELFIKDTAGQKIVLNVSREGEIFGELALLDHGGRTATAVALVETELLEIDREGLLLLFRRTPEAALRLLAAMGAM